MSFICYILLTLECIENAFQHGIHGVPSTHKLYIKEQRIIYQSECVLGDIIDFYIWSGGFSDGLHIQWKTKRKDVAYINMRLYDDSIKLAL